MSAKDRQCWAAVAAELGFGNVLPRSFFERPTEQVAEELLGKILVSRKGDHVTGGRIVEVEAYLGAHDPGSHAATRGVTPRNAVMYGLPGRAYVYFTYGMRNMLNLVAHEEDTAGGVLMRGLEPLFGVETMSARRGGVHGRDATNGPGKLAQALGVELEDNGSPLGSGPLAVLEAPPPEETVAVSGRIGLSTGHELDLRFYLEGNTYVSRTRPGPLTKNGPVREGR